MCWCWAMATSLFVDLVNKTPSGKKLVDLVGFMPHTTTAQAEGICW